jgi:predicted DsbA family dithiol-disulfide isomerase
MIELHEEFGDAVLIDYRFVSIFGFARRKLEARWADKGGIAAYAAHVRGIVAGFGHVELHDDAWTKVAPASSSQAHLALCAVRLLEREGAASAGAAATVARGLRHAFFAEARDIAQQEIVLSVVAASGVDARAAAAHLASGRAHAELAGDAEEARDLDVRMSPTLVLNEGRQRLSGNVGYRVIAANVREVLEKRVGQVSWC